MNDEHISRVVLERPSARVVELQVNPRERDDLAVQKLTNDAWGTVTTFNSLSNDFAYTSAERCCELLALQQELPGEIEFLSWRPVLKARELSELARLMDTLSARLDAADATGSQGSPAAVADVDNESVRQLLDRLSARLDEQPGRLSSAGQMLDALERAIARLQAEADQLADTGDFRAEFPASDAETLRDVVKLLCGERNQRVQFQHTSDPMEAPLPCQVKIGHMGFGKGVPLRSLVEHCKRLYQMVFGKDADEVANEPLEQRRARGDAFLASLRIRAIPAADDHQQASESVDP